MAKNHLVEQLAVLFGEPKTADPVAFVSAYSNALRHVPHETLVDATELLVRQRKISSWPTIGECLDAVAQAKRFVKSSGAGLEPIDDFDSWYGGLMAQIAHAQTQREIDTAIGQIAPYAKAMWCSPYRLTAAQEAGAKRANELRQENVRNPAGADV